MKSTKEFIEKYGKRFFTSLSFDKENYQPKLKLVADKETEFIDPKTGKRVKGMTYLVYHYLKGEYYQFLTTSWSLIKKLRDIEEGTIVSIEYKKLKTPEGFRATYDVSVLDKEELTEQDNESVKTFLGETTEEEEEFVFE